MLFSPALLSKKSLLIFIFLLSSLLTLQAKYFNQVVIDAGHGGKDPGAHWHGVLEKKLTLAVAKKLDQILRRHGIRTVMTRKTDHYITLKDRVYIGNKTRNTVFVSIHFDAHTDKSVRGIETYYAGKEGKKLALVVQNELGRRFRTHNRGVKKRADLAVLNKTHCPAILIEGGFISNRWEANRCKQAWYHKILAEEIAQGLLLYRRMRP